MEASTIEGHREHSGWHPWLLDKVAWRGLALAYLAFVAVGVVIGELVIHPLKSTLVGRTDLRISEWFADHRTDGWTAVSTVGSDIADTYIKIGVTIIAVALVALIFRRWLEPMLIGVPLILEATAFITTTVIVGRPRPPVERLGDSGVGTSFPSGHVAAAVVYSAIGVVIFLHQRRTLVRVVTVVVLVAIPVLSAFGRVYRGMHYTTDVIAGAVLGGVAVIVCTRILLAAQRRADVAKEEPASARRAMPGRPQEVTT